MSFFLQNSGTVSRCSVFLKKATTLLCLFAALCGSAIGQQQPPAPVTATPVNRPGTNQENVLSYADMLFKQKQYAIAAQQYQIFLREFPQSPNVQAGWFRLGECYINVGQRTDAVTTFDHLIKTYKKGPFVGSAAYRLAVLNFNAKNYKDSVGYFKAAMSELTKPEAKLQSRFYYARSLQLTRQFKPALQQYESVLKLTAKPEDNPFYERCLLESARLFFDMGDLNKSLERFEELAAKAKTQESKEEALVRGGLLAAEAGKPELSEKFLDQALRFSDTSPWKALAQVGAIFNSFTRKDYDKVIAIYSRLGGNVGAPNESRAKMLLIVGHSFRLKGDLKNARSVYHLVRTKFANQPEGSEAGYRELQLLHQAQDNMLPAMAERYAIEQSQIDNSSKFIDMAFLMKAEWHFNQAENSAGGPGSEFARKNYGLAAEAYSKVRDSQIDEKYQITRLYKQGWSQIESGEYQKGIVTLTRFIKNYPDHALASSALAKRGTAYLTIEDHTYALGDFEELTKKYPDAPELEFAMQQVAVLYGNKRELTKMIDAYTDLLEKFPKTSGQAEARFFMGAGHFDLEQYKKAIPQLKLSRELDPTGFGDKATLRIVLSNYYLEEIDPLAVEARAYLEAAPAPDDPTAKKKKRAEIPPQVLEYLGKKLHEKKDIAGAEFFISAVVDEEAPEKTSKPVWKLLADCRVELKKFAESVPAFDNYLKQTQRPSERASAYLQRGKAQLCLRDFEAARNSARESLRSQKEGRTNAEARILMGDVSAVEGDLEAAAREYLVVSQIFMDPDVTPIALSKAINAYLSLGKKEQAEKLREQLRTAFPDYTPPEKFDDGC